MNITTRPILQDDEPFLWEMLYQALFVPAGQSPFPRDILQQPEIRRYVQDWGQPDDFGLIAMDEDKPVGAVWLRLMKGYGYVDDETPELTIALMPEYRGLGIGTRLMKELFVVAAARFKAISLSVSTDNPAWRLYEQLGFTAVELAGTSMIMKKEL
jgi:ribosomal protein S18 acetylase RimI-like enzyme